MNYDLEAARLKKDWAENPRWKGIERGYTAEEVVRLRGSLHIEHTLARRGAEKLWKLINDEPFVNTLGALTGNQALQQVKAGLKAIYLSGWQVAADANIAGEMYPDQSLYPANSVPAVVRRINNTFIRADQIAHAEGKDDIDYLRADRRRCGSGVRRRAERVRADEGDDRGGCGRRPFRRSARIGQEVRPHGRQGARADARGGRKARRGAARRRLPRRADDPARAHRRGGGRLVTSDIDDNDKPFCTGERTVEGFYKTRSRPRSGGVARPRVRARTPT